MRGGGAVPYLPLWAPLRQVQCSQMSTAATRGETPTWAGGLRLHLGIRIVKRPLTMSDSYSQPRTRREPSVSHVLCSNSCSAIVFLAAFETSIAEFKRFLKTRNSTWSKSWKFRYG